MLKFSKFLTKKGINRANLSYIFFFCFCFLEDTTPPSITGCPVQPVVEQVELGTAGTFVTWTPPTATDLSDPVTVNVNQNPGSFFLVGTMAITYTFTDAANNQNFCTFDVVVTTSKFPSVHGWEQYLSLSITRRVPKSIMNTCRKELCWWWNNLSQFKCLIRVFYIIIYLYHIYIYYDYYQAW